MNKQKIEEMCRKAGLLPVHRGHASGVEILVFDGFVSPANMHKLKTLGVESDAFPMGCFCTFWWAMKSDDAFVIAHPLFCAWNHDAAYAQDGKQPMRINAAMEDARNALAITKLPTLMTDGAMHG